ncbi:MAG TPA: hypothetical protein QGH10_11660, partial [Armatimonadota bacterium]|nr:hypothetical protein [Armatimonadota bacterium]
MPYILYLIILLMGLVWAHLPHTLARFPTDHSPAWTYARLHTVFGLALVYLGIRAFLTLVKHVRGHWDYIWLACDLLLITVVVMLTGGVHSDASLLYLWPILTVLVKRHARGAVGIGLCVLALFVIAAWPKDSSLFEIGKTVSRAFVVVIYTAIAACYAGIEKGRVEEVARLREEVALGEYR